MGAAVCSRCTPADSSEKVGWSAANGESDEQPTSFHARFGGFAAGDLPGERRNHIDDFYNVDKDAVLGQGSCAVVYSCAAKDTLQKFAVKSINRRALRSSTQSSTEVRLMKRLDHPNIMRLVESFEDGQTTYLILELCTGGELFDYIVDEGPLNERSAISGLRQMLHAVGHLHSNNIVHRDLKAENWLLAEQGPLEKAALKLGDFGAARILGPNEFASTKVGTPYYVAPEVLTGRYDSKADVWSLGIILHMMLGGSPPFAGKNTEEVLQHVKSQKVRVDAFGRAVSEHSKQLLSKLLNRNTAKRPSVSEVLEDAWLAKHARADEPAAAPSSVEQIKGFGQTTQMQKATLAVIASQMSRESIADLERKFVAMDTNGDGTLSLTELAAALESAGVKMKMRELEDIVKKVDSNGSGCVEYSEFISIMMDQAMFTREDVCRKAFNAFDLDGSGFIDRAELKRLFGNPEVCRELGDSVGEVDAMCSEMDANADGKIDFEEFMQMMAHVGSKRRPR